jgi:hypothetical protein
MSLILHSNRLRLFTVSLVSRLLALVILSSFAVTQFPIASTLAEEVMPCCVGKTEGHCDSGLTAPKPRPLITEEMCGLPKPVETRSHNHGLLNAETTSHNADAESNTSQVTADSLSQPCRMDCGACVSGVSRVTRDKSVVHSKTTHTSPLTIAARYDSRAAFFSSNEKWTRLIPRGPPSSSFPL